MSAPCDADDSAFLLALLPRDLCPAPVSSPILRLLEHQLQTQRRSYDNEVEALRGELQCVKEENNRQQQLLAQNLQLPPEARIEASLQHEITRLTNENLVCCSANYCKPESRNSHIQCSKVLPFLTSFI